MNWRCEKWPGPLELTMCLFVLVAIDALFTANLCTHNDLSQEERRYDLLMTVLSIFSTLMLCGAVGLTYYMRSKWEMDPLNDLEEGTQFSQNECNNIKQQKMDTGDPPTFEDALKNSSPVIYVNMEESPPSYNES